MSTTAELVYETVKTLPEESAREVLDFAEYLQQKHERPLKKGRPLLDFAGLLADSPSFKGDPVAIQKALRDEWD